MPIRKFLPGKVFEPEKLAIPNEAFQGACDDQIRRTSYELARELQSIKIREVREALVAAGYRHLTAQARALGLSRSTTWSILQANHKNIGISGAVIKRMLEQPELPSLVRAKILEYVDEKSAGAYGHRGPQLRRFAASLTGELRSRVQSSDV